MKRAGLFLSLLAAAGCAVPPDAQRDYCGAREAPAGLDFTHHPEAVALQAALDGAVASRHLAGVTLAVRSRGALFVGASGQCDIAREVPMQPFTRSRVGSITKAFVSAAILKLAEEGRLDLDDVVARHLDEKLAARIVNSDRITLRQLLTHRSGLVMEPERLTEKLDQYRDDPSHALSPDEYLAMLSGTPALFEPGASYSYSNFGYVVLGRVLEHATGEDRYTVIRTRVLEPLGLHDTLLDGVTRTPAGLARGYMDRGANAVLTDASNWDATHVLETHAGLVSTAADVAAFFDALLNGSFLSPASRAQLVDCVPLPVPDWGRDGYGLGMSCGPLGGTPTFNLAGHQLGYLSVALVRPDSQAVAVVLSNGSNGKLSDGLDDFVQKDLMPLLE